MGDTSGLTRAIAIFVSGVIGVGLAGSVLVLLSVGSSRWSVMMLFTPLVVIAVAGLIVSGAGLALSAFVRERMRNS